jgi:immune inhibitor A
VRINLPSTIVTDTLLLPGSTQAWWTNNDATWADLRLTRDLNLTGVTAPISISFDLDGAAELDWDYLFLEVSVDGGATYTQTKGFEVGSNTELTTPDGYTDPNHRLADYGGLRYGYTGDTGGWIRAYHNLSAYAGQNIKVRFRYATDAGFQERGYFVDNIVIRAGANVILNDPVEGGNANGWTPEVKSFVVGEVPSAGWVFATGVRVLPLYYLLEWRNADGFDKGLLYTYNSVFLETAANGGDDWYVDKVRSNIPGMLVWLRDTRFGNEPFGADNQIVNTGNQFLASPSDGAKGGLLVVDAHPDPLRGPANSTVNAGFGAVPFPPKDNWSGRVQTTNSAFTTRATPQITLTLASGTAQAATTVLTRTTYAPLPAVTGFHDAFGYYPGVEALPQPLTTFSAATTPFLRVKGYAFSDPDASVVVPAKDYYPPRTPAGFTGAGFETSPPAANVSTFETIIRHTSDGSLEFWNVGDPGGFNVTGQQTGNPGTYGVQYGYHFQILGQALNGSYGTIRLWNGTYAGQASTSFSGGGSATQPLTVTVGLQNTGSAAPLTLYSDFDESKAAYVEGSATNGAVPVRASLAQVEAALRFGGAAGLRALAVSPGQATAVAWSSQGALATGETVSFSYALSRKAGAPAAKIVNHVFGPSFSGESVAQFGSTLFVPVSRK